MTLTESASTQEIISGADSIIQQFWRFTRFGLVGGSGFVVNTVVLYLAVSWLGLHYLAGVIVATQVSTAWNFVLTDAWVFEVGERHWNAPLRAAQFWVLNNAFLVLRGPMVWALTQQLGFNYLISNVASLVAVMGFRFAVADRLIWKRSKLTEVRARNLIGQRVIGQRGYQKAVGPERRMEFDQPLTDRLSWLVRLGIGAAIATPALVLRLVHLNALGFNSDEAVYAGQAASIAGDPVLSVYFPIFRAHPLLFQTVLSVIYQFGVSPLRGRLLSAAFGVGTVFICYLLGKRLYGRRAGAIAALLLAVMPYHVIVSRQVLLDGPMVFFSTVSLYFLARYAQTQRDGMLYGAAAFLGLTALTNERSVIMLGGVYLFFALVPAVKVKYHALLLSMVIFVLVVLPYPLSILFSGKSTTGEQFLAWQLFRRANHGYLFYPTMVPPAIGWVTLLAAAGGLILMRRSNGWRETLLLTWCAVPLIFFEIWSVKGFQYLLALAPPLAILAGRALSGIPDRVSSALEFEKRGAVRVAAVFIAAALLASASWNQVSPAQAGQSFLAGSGGVPGGREAGEWIEENIPKGSELLAIGPSMANILQWYGDRRTYGLSVSPNPLHRNPVYEPIVNPDLILRNGDVQYLVWDSFSASRSEFFAAKLLTFAERYHGRIVHQEFVEIETDSGEIVRQPVIVIYAVRP